MSLSWATVEYKSYGGDAVGKVIATIWHPTGVGEPTHAAYFLGMRIGLYMTGDEARAAADQAYEYVCRPWWRRLWS